MNSLKIISRGHQNVLDAIKDLPEKAWSEGLVTGTWTVKDIINHLAVYEEMQLEALQKVLNPNSPTPLLDHKASAQLAEFNRSQEDKNKIWQDILERYNSSQAKLEQTVTGIAKELMAEPDTTTWYGEPASLEDVLAYNYGHKKHHLAQIKLFRQRNNI